MKTEKRRKILSRRWDGKWAKGVGIQSIWT